MKRTAVTTCPGCGRAFRPLRRDEGTVYFPPHVRALLDPSKAWCNGAPVEVAKISGPVGVVLRVVEGPTCGALDLAAAARDLADECLRELRGGDRECSRCSRISPPAHEQHAAGCPVAAVRAALALLDDGGARG